MYIINTSTQKDLLDRIASSQYPKKAFVTLEGIELLDKMYLPQIERSYVVCRVEVRPKDIFDYYIFQYRTHFPWKEGNKRLQEFLPKLEKCIQETGGEYILRNHILPIQQAYTI